MQRPTIFGFTGQNANQALAAATEATAAFFAEHGYDTTIIDLNIPDAGTQLFPLIAARRPLFAFGLAGVGADLLWNDENLWDRLRIPFLSMLFDHPCYIPNRHRLASRYVANCYYARDFYDVQRRYIKSLQPAYMLRPEFPAIAASLHKPWPERDIGLLFVKGGARSADITEGWQRNLPAPLTDLLETLAEILRYDRKQAITDLVADAIMHLPESLRAAPDLFWRMVRTLDTYIRRWRAERVAKVLATIPAACVIGDGWDHLHDAQVVARFIPAMPAAAVAPLYGRARLVVNSNPYFRYGLHERVVIGLRSGAAVATDRNDLSDAWFNRMNNLFGFEWTEDEEALRLRLVRAIAHDRSDATTASCAILDHHLGAQRLINAIRAVVREITDQSFQGENAA